MEDICENKSHVASLKQFSLIFSRDFSKGLSGQSDIDLLVPLGRNDQDLSQICLRTRYHSTSYQITSLPRFEIRFDYNLSYGSASLRHIGSCWKLKWGPQEQLAESHLKLDSLCNACCINCHQSRYNEYGILQSSNLEH